MIKVYEFHWKGYNRFGQKLCGKQLAETREQVLQQLSAQGFEQLKIQRNFILPSRPKSEAVTQTLNQLSLLLNAAIPLKQSLMLLLANCTHIGLYRWIKQTILQLENGFALSESLSKNEHYLTVQEIQLIKIGEKSGKLPLILANIVENRFKHEKLNKKVKKILFYPLIIFTISILLSILLLLFIVPEFAALYQTKEKELPLITALLFNTSAFLQHSANFLLLAIALTTLVLFLFRKNIKLTKWKYIFLEKLPFLGNILNQARIIFFCQNSGLMLNAHLRLDTVLSSFIQEDSQDPKLSQTMQIALERLKQGYAVHESLNPIIFPNDTLQMISIGEKSGKLAKMLLHISEMYQQKLDYQIDLLSQLLEPILMLVIGIIIGTILIGLYLPIFDMGAMIE